MSVWDAYCKLIDRRSMRYGEDEWIRDSQRDIEQAAVFDFGRVDRLVMDQRGAEPFDPPRFFLPFPTCAIEAEVKFNGDPAMVLEDGSTHIIPTTATHYKVVCLMGRPDGHEIGFGDGDTEWPVMVATLLTNQPGIMRITKIVLSGPLNLSPPGGGCAVQSGLFSMCDYAVATGKCLHAWRHGQPRGDPLLDHASKECTGLALNAMEMIHTANAPANWVVQVTDEHARVMKRRGKTVAERRTRYIVIPDRDLDRVLRLPNEGGDHIDRAPHRRRAHWRRLMSPRFRLKRGQRVFVKESWVGPKDVTHGGEHYTVLTSLPSSREDAAG